MMFFKWVAGFFEDQKGGSSSKRGTLFICLIYLGWIIHLSSINKKVDEMTLFSVVGIILFCIGAVTSEFFDKKFPTNKDVK